MTDDLPQHMRTCAAHLDGVGPADITERMPAVNDAIKLLREGADLIEKLQPEDLGDPMEVIEAEAMPPSPLEDGPVTGVIQKPVWFGTDPGTFTAARKNPRTCPKCGSHAAKNVQRQGRDIWLNCSACDWSWRYAP